MHLSVMHIYLRINLLFQEVLFYVLYSAPQWSYSFVPAVVVVNQRRYNDVTTTFDSSSSLEFSKMVMKMKMIRPSFILSSSTASDLDKVSSNDSGENENNGIPEITNVPFDGLEDRFDRWKFLQDFLDGDASPDVVDVVLYRALESVLKYPRPNGRAEGGGNNDDNKGVVEDEVVEMTMEVKENLEQIVSEYSTEGRIPIVILTRIDMRDCDDENKTQQQLQQSVILEQLEKLLPDPIENEEDHKSAWDTIIEIHGRESIKIDESQIPISMEWKIANTVSRLLVHFDFLQLGIVTSPLI